MQKEKCIFVFNLPPTDHKAIIDTLHTLHHVAYYIKESNSYLHNTTLIACIYNHPIALDIIRNLNNKKIENNTLYVLPYAQLSTELKKNVELEQFDLYSLLGWQVNRRNEQMVVCNNECVRVCDNTWSGDIEAVQSFDARKAVGSRNGLFVAMLYAEEIIVYGNKQEMLKPYHVIKMQNATNVYFLEDDFYLFVEYKEIYNYTCVINLVTGKNVFVVKCGKEKVEMFADKRVCYLRNTNCIFERKNVESSKKMFFDNETRVHEKFMPVVDEFMGHKTAVIERIHEGNHFLAVLTTEKEKTIWLYHRGSLIKRKTYPNFVDCQFYNAKERIFVVVEKSVNERTIISVESIKADGESTINNIKEGVAAIKVADDGFVVNTVDCSIMFFVRTGVYSLVRTVRKLHKTIFALNKNGRICCIYDYDKDMVEFYDGGVVVNRVPHPNCTDIQWSQSGLYCATMSLGAGLSGLVQMFDINGNHLWKQIFNKLSHFEWRNYLVNEECVDFVRENYGTLVGEVEEEDKDIKQKSALQAKTNVQETYNQWISFLMQKKEEIEKYCINK